MKRFRLYKTGTHVYVQEYQQTLFGMMWHVLVTFHRQCEPESKAVVSMLNKCNDKSHDNDTR